MICPQDGDTALHLAAVHSHTEIVKLLLEKGADVSTRSNVSQNMSLYILRAVRRNGQGSILLYCIALCYIILLYIIAVLSCT